MKSLVFLLAFVLALAAATSVAEARPRLFRYACAGRPGAACVGRSAPQAFPEISQGCVGGQCAVGRR